MYSFIRSFPAVLGAALLECMNFVEMKNAGAVVVTGGDIGIYLAGMLVAAVVGYISIKTMLVIVRKKKFTWFAIYCFLIGGISVAGYFMV